MKRRLWPVLVASGIGIAILLSLGVWQVKRLAWKEALIASIDASFAAQPIGWSDAMALPNPVNMKVAVNGEFKTDDYILVLTTQSGGPAWTVVRPFKTMDGASIAVALGKSLSEEPPPKPNGTLSLLGMTMGHTGERGLFDPENPKSGRILYWYDPAVIKERLDVSLRHFSLQLLPSSPGTEGLQVDPPKANLRNNHLGYAITWFGLAAVLAAMTVLLVRAQRKED